MLLAAQIIIVDPASRSRTQRKRVLFFVILDGVLDSTHDGERQNNGDKRRNGHDDFHIAFLLRFFLKLRQMRKIDQHRPLTRPIRILLRLIERIDDSARCREFFLTLLEFFKTAHAHTCDGRFAFRFLFIRNEGKRCLSLFNAAKENHR